MRYLLILPIAFLFSCKSKLDTAQANVYSDTAIHQFIKNGYNALKSAEAFTNKKQFEFTNNPWNIKETDTLCIRFSSFPVYYGPFHMKGIAGFDTALLNKRTFEPRIYVQRGKTVYIFNTDIVYEMKADQPSVKLTFAEDNQEWTRFTLNWPEPKPAYMK